MYFDFKVVIPKEKGKIFERTIKGVTYINYEYDRIYKPDKKYNIPKRTTIGKKCEDAPSMMYPNPNFLTYFPDAELPEDEGRTDRSSCLRIGTFLVLEKLMMESMLDKIVSDIYNDNRGSGLFLDLVSYYLTTENNAGQYYPDYAYNHPLFTPEYKIYSDSTVSEFLGQISKDDAVKFQNEWNAIKKNKEKIYISYDSSNKNCQAGDIELVEFGHAKEEKGLPVFNYSIAYDCHNREPLFYEDYPGSIVDVSQLQCMLDKAKAYGYKNTGFILDRGYFSRENIRYMDKYGYLEYSQKVAQDFVNVVTFRQKGGNNVFFLRSGSGEKMLINRKGNDGWESYDIHPNPSINNDLLEGLNVRYLLTMASCDSDDSFIMSVPANMVAGASVNGKVVDEEDNPIIIKYQLKK